MGQSTEAHADVMLASILANADLCAAVFTSKEAEATARAAFHLKRACGLPWEKAVSFAEQMVSEFGPKVCDMQLSEVRVEERTAKLSDLLSDEG